MRALLTLLLAPALVATVAACGGQRQPQASPSAPAPGAGAATSASVTNVPAPQGCDPDAEIARPSNVPHEAWAPPTASGAATGRTPLTQAQAEERARERGGVGGQDVDVETALGPLRDAGLDPAPQGAPERCVYVVSVAAPLAGATAGPTASPGAGYVVVVDYRTGEILATQPR